MIKYNNNTINDWNFDTSNVIKVYRNNAIVFYKISGESPTPEYKVCFAVVDDISQYADREFEDVFDNATEKWFKLNNLNEYEEYGVYGSGRNITYYKGKLTIDDETTSRLPQGYTEVEYVQNNTQGAYLNLGVKLYGAIGNSYQITARYKSQYMPNWSSGEYLQTIINSEGVSSPYYGMTFRYAYNTHVLELAGGDKSNITWTNTDNGDGTSALTISSNSTVHADQVPLGLFASYQGNYTTPYRWSNTTIYSMQITLNNELVRDLVPCIRDNDSMVGMYDLVNDVFYYPPNYQSYQLVAGELVIEPTKTYEYEWNGSSWVNVGEVTRSSKTSDFKIGDIDTPITNDASLITDGMYGVILPVSLSSNTSSAVALMGSSDTNTLSNLSSHTKTSVISENDIIDYAVWKFHGTATANTFYVENIATKKYFGYSNVSISYMPLVDESSKVPTVFSAFTYNNVTALGICKGNTPNQYYAINDLYGNHNQYNWFNPLSSAGDLNNSYVIYKLKGSDAEYPKYYSEKSEPLDNLTFNTLAEAQTYAYNNCVYDGMRAIIDGDRYYFDSSDENGWVKITEHYDELEYIQCGNGTTTTNGGLQLLTNATADYYFEVEAQCVMRGTSPMLIGEKSSVEVVSYQLGLCYYSSMFLDYGGGRLSTNINSTTQNQRHIYGAGHISGSSNPNVVGLKLDGVVQNTTNATTRVEGLPYLVGCGVGYTGHSASDVSVGTSNADVVKLYSVKIYKDYGDTLVGDYIPVINSDNVVTLYDKVSGNYATPYGTLIAGPIV